MELTEFNSEKKFNSRFIVEQVNLFRSLEGNRSELLHKNLLVKIEDEFKDEINELKIQPVQLPDAKGELRKVYELNFEQSLQILMSESKTVRKRCIEVLKSQNKPKELSRLEILEIAIESEKKVLQLREKIEQDKEKVQFFDTVTGSEDCIDMGQVAKVCNLGIGRNRLFEFLRENKILDGKNSPYQTFIDRGYFRTIESSYTKPDGSTHISIKTVVFQKGVDFIIKKYNNR